MKKIILSLFTCSIVLSTQAQDNLVNSLKANASDSSKAKYQFTTIIDLEDSPVKNQGSSGTCWSYSGNSFLESEMIKKGKENVRNTYQNTVNNLSNNLYPKSEEFETIKNKLENYRELSDREKQIYNKYSEKFSGYPSAI